MDNYFLHLRTSMSTQLAYRFAIVTFLLTPLPCPELVPLLLLLVVPDREAPSTRSPYQVTPH